MAKKNIYGETPETVRKRSRKEQAEESKEMRQRKASPASLVSKESIAMEIAEMKTPEGRANRLTRLENKRDLKPSRHTNPPQRGQYRHD